MSEKGMGRRDFLKAAALSASRWGQRACSQDVRPRSRKARRPAARWQAETSRGTRRRTSSSWVPAPAPSRRWAAKKLGAESVVLLEKGNMWGGHRGHVGRRHGHPAHRRREGGGRRGLDGRGARVLQERERGPREPRRAGIVRDERQRFSELAARDHGLAVQPQPPVRRLLRAPCRMEADGTRQPGLRQGRDADHGGGNVDRPAGRPRRGRGRDHDGDAGHAAGHRFDGCRRGRQGDVGQGRGGRQGGRRHPRNGRVRP